MLRRTLPVVCLFATLVSVIPANSSNTSRRLAPAQPRYQQFFAGGATYFPVFLSSPSSPDNWLGGSGNWSNSGQWSSGLPVQTSDVVINTGNDNVTWDTSSNINSLTLGGASGSSILADNVGNNLTMNIAGALTINHSGSLSIGSLSGVGDMIIANADSSNAGTMNIGLFSGVQVNGNFTNSGGIGLNGFYGVGGSNFSVSGNLINAAGGGISDNGSLTGNVHVGGALQNSGQISVSTLAVVGMLTNNTNGYVEVDGGGSAGTLSNAGRMTIYNTFDSENATNSGSITVFYGAEGVSGGFWNVAGTLNNSATGTITVSGYPGEELDAHILNNSGSLQLIGGGQLQSENVTNSGVIATSNPLPNTIDISGRFTNAPTGTLQLLGSTGDTAHIINLINQGTIIVGNTSTLAVPVSSNAAGNALAGFLNSGSVLVQEGGTISAYGKYTQTTGQTVVDGHLSGIFNFAGGSVYGNNGTITGNVTSNASINFGDAPLTVGTLNFAGNYTQGANGSLTFDIASQNSYDKMNITGQAHLNGLMTIDLLHNYVPQIGNMFEIMSFAGESGTFSNVVGLPINGQEHFTLQYNSNNLTLDVVSGQLTGLSSLKTGSTNNEPFVQIAEAGMPAQLGESSGGGQTTPEPSSLLLFGSGMVGLIGWARRKLN